MAKFYCKDSWFVQAIIETNLLRYCENNEEYSEIAFKFASWRPYLQSYCYVPVNCVLIILAIFCSLLSGGLKSLDKLDSITTILVVGIHRFIELQHLRGSVGCFLVKELFETALKAFAAKRLQFKKIKLERAGVNKENASAFSTTQWLNIS